MLTREKLVVLKEDMLILKKKKIKKKYKMSTWLCMYNFSMSHC